MHLALMGLFRAHWSAEVHEEWIRNLLKNRPDLTSEKLARRRRLMDEALPDASVSKYEHLIASIVLPDPGDRHVVAAAIRSGVSLIVTQNLTDFPDGVLGQFNLEAQHPDDFVIALLGISGELVLEAARNHRASLKNPTKTTDEYLSELGAQGLRKTAAALCEPARSDSISAFWRHSSGSVAKWEIGRCRLFGTGASIVKAQSRSSAAVGITSDYR